jgi:hypothetical protein
MLVAVRAVLLKLHPGGMLLLVLGSSIIAALALAASQDHNISHG